MRRNTIAAVLSLLVLGACGMPMPWQDQGGDVGIGTTGTTAGGPGVVDPGAGPQMVQPQGPTANPHPVSFEVLAVDGDEVTVTWWSGVAPCAVLDEVQVDEGDEAVTLTVVEGADRAEPDTACIGIALQKATVVTLDAELGDRTVIDGSTGTPAARSAPADQPEGGQETVDGPTTGG